MKRNETRKRQTNPHPLAKLNLKIEVSEEDILADLHYPARPTRAGRRRS